MADFIRRTYVPAAAQSLSPPAEKFLVESSWSKVRGRDLLISARRSGVGYEHPGGGPTAVTRRGMLSIRASPLSPRTSASLQKSRSSAVHSFPKHLTGHYRDRNETFDNDRPKAPDIINFLKASRNPMASSFRVCNLAVRRLRVNNPSVSTRLMVPASEPLAKAWPVNGFDPGAVQ